MTGWVDVFTSKTISFLCTWESERTDLIILRHWHLRVVGRG